MMVKCIGSNWLITCGRPASPRLGLPDVPVLRSSGIGANCITIINAMLSVSRPYTVHMHGRGGVKYPTSISACRPLGNDIPKATGYLYVFRVNYTTVLSGSIKLSIYRLHVLCCGKCCSQMFSMH